MSLMQCRRGRRRSESGTAALEFALVLPLLLTVLLGTVTTGLSYSRALGVSSGVREGARFGATAACAPSPAVPACSPAMSGWTQAVIDRTRALEFDTTTTDTTVCVQLLRSTSTTGTGSQLLQQCSPSAHPGLTNAAVAATAVPPGTPVGTCVVRVLGARSFEIFGAFGQLDGWAARSSISRFERTDVYSSATTCQ